MPTVHEILKERGERYGSFQGHAELTQELKVVMSTHEGWKNLVSDQREALDMISHKIGRIINGDPNYIDSWQDIIGYAQLVKDRLEKEHQVVQPSASQQENEPECDCGNNPHDIDCWIAVGKQYRKENRESGATTKEVVIRY